MKQQSFKIDTAAAAAAAAAGGSSAAMTNTMRSGRPSTTTGGGTSRPAEPSEPYVTKYGYVSARRPQNGAVPFGDAKRDERPPGGAGDVPFHYLPPPMSARDPNADIKNSGFVPMAMSTREQWQNVHMKVQSSESAGPGAYDLPRGERVLSHVIHHGVSFPLSARQVHRSVRTPGPTDYRAQESLLAYMLRQPTKVSFPVAVRRLGVPPSCNVAPYDTRDAYEALSGRHSARMAFGGAPGHEGKARDADHVPIRDGDRGRRRPVTGMPMGRAQRWGAVASTF